MGGRRGWRGRKLRREEEREREGGSSDAVVRTESEVRSFSFPLLLPSLSPTVENTTDKKKKEKVAFCLPSSSSSSTLGPLLFPVFLSPFLLLTHALSRSVSHPSLSFYGPPPPSTSSVSCLSPLRSGASAASGVGRRRDGRRRRWLSVRVKSPPRKEVR